MAFLSLRHGRLSHEMSPAARGEERCLYSQALPLFPTVLFFTTMLSIALLLHSLETVLVMALYYYCVFPFLGTTCMESAEKEKIVSIHMI